MIRKSISVPKDEFAKQLVNNGVEREGLEEKVLLSEEETYNLDRDGFFELANNASGSMIDHYECESLSPEQAKLVLNAIQENDEISDKIKRYRIEELLELCIKHNTEITFDF